MAQRQPSEKQLETSAQPHKTYGAKTPRRHEATAQSNSAADQAASEMMIRNIMSALMAQE